MILYHGSRYAKEICLTGFDLWAPRTSDVGDLGWGIYLTSNWHEARRYAGPQGGVLEVDVNTDDFLFVKERFKGPHTDAEKLWWEVIGADDEGRLLTVSLPHPEREEHSKRVRQRFLDMGIKGVATGPYRGDYEVVVFDPEAIEAMRMAARQPDPED